MPFIFCSGRDKTIKILLEHGADVNDKNDEGVTPLHTAAMLGDWSVYNFHHRFFKLVWCFSCPGHFKAIEILLDHGAYDIDNKSNNTVLHVAAENGQSSKFTIFFH